MDWADHFTDEAVNTFRFGHIVNQIQLDCNLAEYTAMPSPHGIGCALQQLKPNPIPLCHLVDCESTRQK